MKLSNIAGLMLLLFSALLTTQPALAAGDGGDPDAIGHSADGYYWDLSPLGKVELPRLFVVRRPDGSLGFDAFLSTHSALAHGPYSLGKPQAEATTAPEAAVMTTEELEEAIAGHAHVYYPVVYAQPGGEIVLDLSITRQTLFMFFSALLLLVLGLWMARRYRGDAGRAPRGKLQNLLETVIVFIRDDVAKPTMGRKYRRYLPYLLTAFFFILFGNLLGLVPWGVTATSSIMVTGTLAAFTFVITQFSGTKDYWQHILWPPNVPVPIKFILIPVEIIGLFTKPLALAFRLFGNMVSGHLVIVSIIGLIFIFAARIGAGVGATMIPVSIALTVFMYGLKLIVSFVQAYIFTMLSAVFIGMAVEEHEHHPEHEHMGEAHNRLPHGGDELPAGEHQLEDYASPTPNHPSLTVVPA